jgi:hypothetical protein
MKLTRIIPIFLLLVIACSEHVSEPSHHPSPWKEETLLPGMTISFPRGYEGPGFWCGFDACYFGKSRSDGCVHFNFALGPMTGNVPAEFDELPDLFRHPHRELITTDCGLEGALYYALESENKCVKSVGTFFIEKYGTSGFHEVVWVMYDDSCHVHVCDVLRTIKYANE